MFEVFLSSFISLFIIVDPLGTAMVYSVLTRDELPKDRLWIAIKGCLIATCLLLFFGIAGKVILTHAGISLDAFRIAGGLLLFITAFRIIMRQDVGDTINLRALEAEDKHHLAVFPMAIPMLAGPGCLTVIILNINSVTLFNEKLLVLSTIFIVQAMAFVCLISASKIVGFMGRSASGLLAKLVGILLAALSVQFIADGVIGLFVPLFVKI
jgi:multiple antibiotic resistance protein